MAKRKRDRTNPKPDAHAVDCAIGFLKRHGCPTPRHGEGSELFKPRNGLKTPDVIAGEFRGESHPRTFFIDVVAPTGDQVTNELAGAPQASRFLMREVTMKTGKEWSLADIPLGLGKPLAGSVLKKASKYSNARGGSPLLGVVAYFNEQGSGQQIFTMMAYLKAIHDELGQLSEHLVGYLLAREHEVILQLLNWDVPLAFLLQLVENCSHLRGALVVNEHSRLDMYRDHEVVAWARGLAEGAATIVA